MIRAEHHATLRQFLLFGVAGTLGFLVDAGVVSVLVNGLDCNPYGARIISFLCAVAATFAFNRRYTFSSTTEASLLRQAGHYLLAMSGGFVVNYGVYAVMIYGVAIIRQWPFLGVAAGSIAGMLVNYASARFWVFRTRPDQGNDRA